VDFGLELSSCLIPERGSLKQKGEE